MFQKNKIKRIFEPNRRIIGKKHIECWLMCSVFAATVVTETGSK